MGYAHGNRYRNLRVFELPALAILRLYRVLRFHSDAPTTETRGEGSRALPGWRRHKSDDTQARIYPIWSSNRSSATSSFCWVSYVPLAIWERMLLTKS